MFALMNSINANNIAGSVAMKLFSSYINPLLTYNCEIWGPKYLKILVKNEYNSFFCSLDKLPFEQVQTKFCKWILGVNRYTSNSGARAEFGIFPLLIYVFKHSLDF